MPANFIPKEQLSAYQRWELAAFDEEAKEKAAAEAAANEPAAEKTAGATIKLPTAEEIERIHNEAHNAGYAGGQDIGFAAGYEAGFEGGRSDGFAAGFAAGSESAASTARREAAQIADIAAHLQKSLRELDQQIAEDLLDLAIGIASQVLRQTLRLRPESLLPIVRQAIAALPLNHAPPALYINPADAALLRANLGESVDGEAWRLIEDDTVSAGGCRIVADASEIDASVETRWRRVIEAIGSSDTAWLAEEKKRDRD